MHGYKSFLLYFSQKCYNFKFYIWIFELIVKIFVYGARHESKVGFLFAAYFSWMFQEDLLKIL